MIGIYVRLSKEDDDSNSIKNQIREGKQYAKLNGYNDDQIIIYNEGEGLKGSTPIKKRPALTQLINDVESDIITLIYVRKQSRIARKMKVLEEFLEPLIQKGVKLFMGDKGMLDLALPTTRMMLQIFASFDEFSPASQSFETKRTLKANAEEGKVAGILPYGYTADEHSMPQIIKEEQKVIKRIFKLYLTNIGCQKIANILNEENVPTKYGRLEKEDKTKTITSHRKHRNGVIWQSSTIYGILKNTWYNGIRTYQNVEYNVPRMVSKKDFQLVQKKLSNNKYQRFDGTPKYNYLLKGILKCAKCGRNYIGRFRANKNDNYYQCSSKRSGATNCGALLININKIESFIIHHLFNNKDLLTHIESIQNENKTLKILKEQLKQLQQEENKTTLKLKRYAKAIGDEDDKDDLLLNNYNTAKKQLKEIKQKIITQEHKIELATSDEAFKDYKTTFKTIQQSNDFTTLNQATHSIIDTIIIDSNTDKDNTKFFTLQINYKALNLGENNYTIWKTKRPLNTWINQQETTPATPKQLKEHNKEELEMIKGLEQYHNIDLQSKYIPDNSPLEITTKSKFNNIILNKENLFKFNHKLTS